VAPIGREVSFEPRSDLEPERFFLRREAEIHDSRI
jgi:hypothetical protein